MRQFCANDLLGLSLCISLCAAQISRRQVPGFKLVETSLGVVNGSILAETSQFLGMRYAEPMSRIDRWRPPTPKKAWSSPIQAMAYGRPCPQVVMDQRTGIPVNHSEDCLTLNLWEPDPRPPSPMPVLVWLYGGGFVGGAAGVPLYNGSRLATAAQSIVVSLNSHTGALGYLALPELAREGNGTGNYGIVQQQECLRFLQKVVSGFGGDPSRVMLFGQSSGGMSVAAHILSPQSAGLFSSAAIESGPPVGIEGIDAYAANTLQQGMTLGEGISHQVGCPPGPDRMACLRNTSAAKLVAATPCWKSCATGLSLTVDGYTLPAAPYQLFREGRFNRISGLVIGVNKDESFQAATLSRHMTMAGLENATQTMLEMYVNATEAQEATQSLLRLYSVGSGWQPYDTPWEAFDALATDFQVGCLSRETAAMAGKRVPTYLYLFAHGATVPILPEMPPGLAGHTAEIPFVFGTPDGVLNSGGRRYVFSHSEAQLSERLQQRWGALAASGSPTLMRGVHWPPFNSSEAGGGARMCLDLEEELMDNEARMGAQRCSFWQQFREDVRAQA